VSRRSTRRSTPSVISSSTRLKNRSKTDWVRGVSWRAVRVERFRSIPEGDDHVGGRQGLEGSGGDYDSTLVTRYKQAGLVIFGKTTSPELGLRRPPNLFCMARRATRGPERTSGGSSGGASSAVASRILPMARGAVARRIRSRVGCGRSPTRRPRPMAGCGWRQPTTPAGRASARSFQVPRVARLAIQNRFVVVVSRVPAT